MLAFREADGSLQCYRTLYICRGAGPLENHALQSEEEIAVTTYAGQVRAATCSSDSAICRELIEK